MSIPTLVLCLGNLALIGALPRIFFQPGRLGLRWWITAAPFLVTAAVLLAAVLGLVAPAVRASNAANSLAAVLCAGSLVLIGFTLGTHREPLPLWHQADGLPRKLVTHGAYSRARHPFYSAFLLALLGCAVALPHWGTLTALVYACVQLNRTAAREEDALLGSPLGGEYREYMNAAGRFWPRVRSARAWTPEELRPHVWNRQQPGEVGLRSESR